MKRRVAIVLPAFLFLFLLLIEAGVRLHRLGVRAAWLGWTLLRRAGLLGRWTAALFFSHRILLEEFPASKA
jgi:hypothetical protein